MLFKDAVSFAQDHWVTLSVLLALSCVSYSYIRAYFFLRGFNGPFLAKLSNFWQLWDTLVDLERPPLQHVHAEYGKAVRIGPDVLSFSSADAARDIYYGVGRDWPKSEAYRVMGTFTRGAADEILFSSTNKPWYGGCPMRQKDARLTRPTGTTTSVAASTPPTQWALSASTRPSSTARLTCSWSSSRSASPTRATGPSMQLSGFASSRRMSSRPSRGADPGNAWRQALTLAAS